MPTGTVMRLPWRHDLGDRLVDVALKAQIAVGENSNQTPLVLAVLGDRHTGDTVLLH